MFKSTLPSKNVIGDINRFALAGSNFMDPAIVDPKTKGAASAPATFSQGNGLSLCRLTKIE